MRTWKATWRVMRRWERVTLATCSIAACAVVSFFLLSFWLTCYFHVRLVQVSVWLSNGQFGLHQGNPPGIVSTNPLYRQPSTFIMHKLSDDPEPLPWEWNISLESTTSTVDAKLPSIYLAIAPLILSAVFVPVARQRTRRFRMNQCECCDYPLGKEQRICPECGRERMGERDKCGVGSSMQPDRKGAACEGVGGRVRSLIVTGHRE